MAINRKITLGKWGAMTGYDSATEYPLKITDLAGDGTSVAGKMLVGKADGSGNFELVTASATGDVSGPGSSTDNAIVRWNGVGGTSIQNSAAILDDNDNLYLPGTLNVTDAVDLDSTLNVDGNVTTGGDITQTVSGTGLAEHTLTSYSANANASQIYQQKARGSLASPTIVLGTDGGDFLGNLRFDAYDGTGFVRVMSQRVRVEGTPGAGDVRGRMVWAAGQQTTPNSDPEDVLMTLTASNANPRLGNLDVTGDISVRGISVGSGGISGSGLSSTTSVIAAIDTDNNSTSEVFAVRSNGSGTNQFSVSEAGNIMGLGTLTLGSGPTTVTDSAGKVLSAALNTVGVAQGGTGATTLTGLLQGNGTSAFTTITNSTTVGQVLRVTGSNTYAWGALDLADTDAVTGILTSGYGGTGNGFTKFTGPTTSEKTFTLPDASSTLLYEGQSANVTLAGDLAVNGGDFTSTDSTFNLLNSGVTTCNFLGAGATINIGNMGTTGQLYTLGMDGGRFEFRRTGGATPASVVIGVQGGTSSPTYGSAINLQGSQILFQTDSSPTDTTNNRTTRLTIADATCTCAVNLAVNGNTTLGDASTDTITCTGRLIPRTLSAASSVAMNAGEVAYYSSNWYGATSTGAITPVRFLTSNDLLPALSIPRTLNINTTEASVDSSTSETTLGSYTVPGGTLASTGDRLEYTAACAVQSDAGESCTVRVKFGSTTLLTIAPSPNANATIHLRVTIIRTGAATQKVIASATTLASLGALAVYTTATETLSGNLNLVLTGQISAVDGTDNKVTHYLSTTSYFPV